VEIAPEDRGLMQPSTCRDNQISTIHLRNWQDIMDERYVFLHAPSVFQSFVIFLYLC